MCSPRHHKASTQFLDARGENSIGLRELALHGGMGQQTSSLPLRRCQGIPIYVMLDNRDVRYILIISIQSRVIGPRNSFLRPFQFRLSFLLVCFRGPSYGCLWRNLCFPSTGDNVPQRFAQMLSPGLFLFVKTTPGNALYTFIADPNSHPTESHVVLFSLTLSVLEDRGFPLSSVVAPPLLKALFGPPVRTCHGGFVS